MFFSDPQCLTDPLETHDTLKATEPHQLGSKPSSHNSDKWPCEFCGKNIGTHSHLKRHLKIHTSDAKFRCTICNVFFESQIEYKKHNNVYHKCPLACHLCGKFFTRASSLREHEKLHSGDLNFQCSACGRVFVSKSKLDRHYGNKHQPRQQSVQTVGNPRVSRNDSRKFPCEFCGKIIIGLSHLKRHVKLHSDEVQFRCTVCNIFFASRMDLEKHNEEKHSVPVVCSYCAKTFTRPFCLRQHVKKFHTIS